jgi:hypothetical protein
MLIDYSRTKVGVVEVSNLVAVSVERVHKWYRLKLRARFKPNINKLEIANQSSVVVVLVLF